jgi:hypothetical protein
LRSAPILTHLPEKEFEQLDNGNGYLYKLRDVGQHHVKELVAGGRGLLAAKAPALFPIGNISGPQNQAFGKRY